MDDEEISTAGCISYFLQLGFGVGCLLAAGVLLLYVVLH
jgi:hypothetical protein